MCPQHPRWVECATGRQEEPGLAEAVVGVEDGRDRLGSRSRRWPRKGRGVRALSPQSRVNGHEMGVRALSPQSRVKGHEMGVRALSPQSRVKGAATGQRSTAGGGRAGGGETGLDFGRVTLETGVGRAKQVRPRLLGA